MVRSGTVAGGDFALARQMFAAANGAAGTMVPLQFVPANSTRATSIKVVLEMADGGAPVTISASQVKEANEWVYLPVNVPINAPGLWKIGVTIADNTGCFLVDFAR